ncbi:glycosyl hydrolase 53 family protein [Limosilactobacillus reuteri]|uniref:glycosyl hydrolase 53 family protein n=1 Tax=Limosilactobacillus reuteri TaxID=1598 RepID=UPI001E550419|nr:glycosyl hydrolase 53 family protein [Limosilactobacillus reuteri]MCC4326793.1 glycosyl hydrolase 53 family protein [Limosilactobacillus reuteri]MCC4335078.1 glycosyl hydrolase 53 family protein [Limosilactobacillus reuteri]MCC4338576.1 glycosyl hydrolase 53 family protein [Limosilactobacillus reuteri]
MELKKHFKLYKSGKQWVTAAVATIAFSAGVLTTTGAVHADTNTGDQQTEQVAQPTQDVKSVSTDASSDTKVVSDNKGNNNQLGNTNVSDKNSSKDSKSTLPGTNPVTQNYDHNDNGNYGYIDSANINNNQLQVSGWSATNQNINKDNHFIIAYDSTSQQELGRTKVETPVARPDVKAVHNVYNAENSGFNVTVPLDINKMQSYRDSIQIVSRYSNALDGNSGNSDYWSQPITFDDRNNAWLDTFKIKDGQLNTAGWNATNQAIGKDYHYIILYDQTANHEVSRQLVKDNNQRPDVAKAYPQVINADKSGFDVTFDATNLDPSHEFRLISRYSDQANGEGNRVDYWFNTARIAPANLSNHGNLDKFDISEAGHVTVEGWHATDLSDLENNQFVILYDLTANRQVASVKPESVSRDDVAKVYPNILNAKDSGFKATFDRINLTPGHSYAVVSRYSTSNTGNGDNGKYTDFWSSPITLNQSAYAIDKVNTTTDGIHIQGWMASDSNATMPNAYVFLMNDKGEVARQEVTLNSRPDVAKVYPGIYNSEISGFEATFKLSKDDLGKLKDNFHILLRFSSAKDGNPSGVDTISDQITPNYSMKDEGNFSYMNIYQNRVEFSGWHDSFTSQEMPNQWVIVLADGKEAGRIKLPKADSNMPQTPQAGSFWDGSNSKFQGGIVLSTDLTNKNVQLIHRYSESNDGNSNYSDYYSPVIKVGAGYSNGRGYGSNSVRTVRDMLSQRVAGYLENKGLKNIAYDWMNQDNQYREVAVHDMAQELAYGDVNNDAQVIAKKLKNDALLDGKVIATAVYNMPDSFNYDQLAKQFVSTVNANTENNDSVVGVGMSNDKLAIILFKPGQASTPAQATSSLSANVSNVYKHSGVTVDVTNGLQKGSVLTADDLGDALKQPSATLFTGDKGTLISEDVLKAIFAALPGNTTALEGTKNYYNGNDAYHYEYWLDGQSADDKMNNFLALNKDAKYGDQLKVNYGATLVYGQETGTETPAVNETPASKKSADDISLAYQNGTESGAQYDTVKVSPIEGMKQDTIRGVDVSSYLALVQNGVQFYDFNGQPADLMKVLSDAGVNYIRIRLWVDPYNAAGQSYGGGIDDEATVLQIAKDAKKYGMKVLIGLHYSDFWADPATQIIPKQWKGLSDEDLNTEVYLYTKKLVNDFKQASVTIDMAQLGNEITKGMLGVRMGNGDINVWKSDPYATKLTNLLKSASTAFRESSKDTQLAVHIETPNMYNYDLIMNSLKTHGVDYDVLASSYYPFWGWEGNNPDNIANIEKMAKDKYGKKFVIAETGWPFTLQNSDGTPNNISYDPGHYPVGPQGQVDELSAMYKAILSNDNGLGAFYWEPAWIPVKAGWDNWQYNKLMGDVAGTGWASITSRGYYPDSKIMYEGKSASGGTSWDNNTLFDDQGHPLQSLMMYKGFLTGYESPANVTSSTDIKVSQIFNNGNVDLVNPLKVNDQLSTDDFISQAGQEYLNGITGTKISDASLKAIFNDLQDGKQSKTYTDKDGNKYHYEFWLDGQTTAEKLNNFLKLNSGMKYGDTLKVNYTATVVKDKEVQTVTSPVHVTLNKVYGLNDVTIDSPLSVGDSMPAEDLANVQKAVNNVLTGAQGTTINGETFKNLRKAIPGVYNATGALEGTKVYTTDTGNHYIYEYWLTTDDLQGANKDAKFGDPINVTYSASLKWVKTA